MKLTILVVTYNQEQYVQQCLDSIIGQNVNFDYEIIIGDDCSIDNTEDIVNKYMKIDSRIKFFKLDTNSGAGVARNNSIKNAQGRFLAFCDSDDCWHPEKLEVQLAFMNEHNYEFSYTSYDTCNEDNKIIGYVKCKKKISYITLLKDNGIGCLTSIYDTARIGKIYMPTIRKRQDWGLWLSVIKKTHYAYGLQKSLAKYRIRENSISANKLSMLKYNYKLYNNVEGFSKISSFILLVFYFLPYYFYKKLKQKIEYKIQIK